MEKKSIQEQIKLLLKEKNAILLAHNYQLPEVQDIADLCGDSLELSIKASSTDADVIVFCGVHFMAETAAILSPEKKVLLPALDAGCPMANMISAEELRRKRAEMPDAVVISYVNTTAEVKAYTDICCTSANVIKVANSVDPSKSIFMTPDRNLAMYTKNNTDRQITFWNGYCPVHNNLTVEQILKTKKEHPDAIFMAHPECPPQILDMADEIKSTSGMIAYATQSNNKEFIIGTEVGILYPLSKANPDKLFFPADKGMVCPDMKKTGLGEILKALQEMQQEVKVPDKIRTMAKDAVDRMLAIPIH